MQKIFDNFNTKNTNSLHSIIKGIIKDKPYVFNNELTNIRDLNILNYNINNYKKSKKKLALLGNKFIFA